jgi:U3 small nucleolar RNA-associated protein 20
MIEMSETLVADCCFSLITHFAHDLGPDFEPYFHNTLLLLVHLSSSDNISIVEWTFNCFAYLFKFLSRLLTTDLKPTYDVLAPILGKSQQKKHVARYTAESMSFLVRKSTGDSLTDIANHIVLDVMTTKRAQFSKAAIDLFTNAMASSGNNLHSRTPSIITAVLNACATQEDQVYASDFASGLIASLLHHVRLESSPVLYAPVLEFVDNSCEQSLLLCTRIVFVLAGLRQGSRVSDWMAVYERGTKVISIMKDTDNQEQPKEELVKASMNLCISILQNADFRASSAHHRKLLDSAFELYGAENFLTFSDALMSQSQKAFKEFMRSYIDKYLKLYWNGNELSIALFLNHVHQLRLVDNSSISFSAPLNIESSEFSKSIKQKVDALAKSKKLESESELFTLWVYIQLYTFALSPKAIKDTLQSLLERLQEVTVKEDVEHLHNAILGKTLSLLSNLDTSNLDDYMPGLKDKLDVYRHSNMFLQGYLDMLKKLKA